MITVLDKSLTVHLFIYFIIFLHWKGLHVAAMSGVTDNCRYLIEEAGVHGNILDSHNQTALFYSIECNALECSEYLLSIGCSANHKNTDGRRYVTNAIHPLHH